MASSSEFADFVCIQISRAGIITSKKMFGEYCLYCDLKPVGLICDDRVFLKITPAGREALRKPLEELPPYDGAKPHFVLDDLDAPAYLSALVRITCDALPAPRPKKPRSPKK